MWRWNLGCYHCHGDCTGSTGTDDFTDALLSHWFHLVRSNNMLYPHPFSAPAWYSFTITPGYILMPIFEGSVSGLMLTVTCGFTRQRWYPSVWQLYLHPQSHVTVCTTVTRIRNKSAVSNTAEAPATNNGRNVNPTVSIQLKGREAKWANPKSSMGNWLKCPEI